MKILMMMKDAERGGVASCVASLAEGLKKYKNVETVIVSSDGDSIGTMLKEVLIIDFASKNPLHVIKNYKNIKKIINEEKIDIIHAQNRVPAFYAALYCFFHRRVKYIWSNHLVPIPSDFIHRALTFYGECAVAEGIDGENMLINNFHINPDKVATVNLGVDFDKFKKLTLVEQLQLKDKYKISYDDKVILLYGRLSPVKGHDFLLDAIKKFSDKKFKLIFPGENHDYKKYLMKRAEELGIFNKIICPGYINSSEWLSISDLMVLPSKQEGFGIVNVESFVMGVPVIRTTTAGYKDMADLCFGIDYGDVDSLEKLLYRFFQSDQAFEEKKKYAKENCYRFSLEAYTNGYYKIYKKIINEKQI